MEEDPGTGGSSSANSSDNSGVAQSIELSAVPASSAQVDLAWTPAAEDQPVAGFRVLRNGEQIAEVGAVAAFEDTDVSAQTTYTYAVEGVDASGEVFSQSNEASTTTPQTDSTPPAVEAVSMEDGTPIPTNSSVTVDFSAPMSKSTVNSDTFRVTSGGAPVAGAVSVNGNTATFTPAARLPATTEHTATVTTNATDSAGNALPAEFATTFATAAAADTTPPRVSYTFPALNTTGVPRNAAIAVTFSEPMTNSSLTASSFNIKRTSGGALVAGAVKVNANTATFTPSAQLAASTQYTATVTTSVLDAAGNALTASYAWTFSTGGSTDSTRPLVTSVNPGNGITGIPLNYSVKVRFSETMAISSLTSTSVKLTRVSSGATVPGTVYVSDTLVGFVPSATLIANAQYRISVSAGAKDASGNALASAFSSTFTTGSGLDTTRPTISSTSPPNSATGVAVNASVSATFSESMRNSTLTTGTMTLTRVGTTNPLQGTITVSNNTATFTPRVPLVAGTQYTATITTGARDAAGNALASAYSWTFAVGASSPTALLTWDAVTATNLSGYRIYYGTSPRTYQQSPGQGINVGNALTYTMTGLNSSTRYYFAVTAFDSSGRESAYSTEVFKDIP